MNTKGNIKVLTPYSTPQTLEPYTPTSGAEYVDGNARWSLTRGKRSDSWSGSYSLFLAPPLLVGVITDGFLQLLSVEPLEAAKTLVHTIALGPTGWENYDDGSTAAFLAEDKAICEQAQRGSRARRWSGGSLVPLERIVGDFHRYLGQRLALKPRR